MLLSLRSAEALNKVKGKRGNLWSRRGGGYSVHGGCSGNSMAKKCYC